jgi:hypothetical protein
LFPRHFQGSGGSWPAYFSARPPGQGTRPIQERWFNWCRLRCPACRQAGLTRGCVGVSIGA